jgi:hypothetical protein
MSGSYWKKRFWPGVAFGISSITASFVELEQCMMRTYYNPLPLGGVRRSISSEIRQLDRVFFGCGLPHPRVECLIDQLENLSTNYGCPSGLGMHLQTSMELMIIEGGVSTQLLTLPFRQYSKWVMHSWLRLVWEKVDKFNIHVEIKDLPLNSPWERDGWLMLMLENAGFSDDKLTRLNRVRCYQQAIFYSGIFKAEGRTLDRCYLTKQPLGATWLQLIFPQEHPPTRDFRLWVSAIESIAPREDRLSDWGVGQTLATKSGQIPPW